jgi:riboflavin kinase / FMN adenylyltransferase
LTLRRDQQSPIASPFTVARSADEWAKALGDSNARTVITIGNFDGVHLGHQRILKAVSDRCAFRSDLREGRGAPIPVVLTFYPHPARIVRPDSAPPLLMTLDQRLAAFGQHHIRAALVLQFDRALAQVSAEDFVRRYLAETMRAEAVLVGANFRFGHRQAGDVNLLRALGEKLGFDVEIVAPVVVDAVIVSSTAIREALRDGRVEVASRLLGRPYSLAGQIWPGTGQGRKLVVPTLNLTTEQELLPKLGVYATEVSLDGTTYAAATNVGVRPTFDGRTTTVESHLLDFSENRTSGPMEVKFLSRLRDEQKFDSPQALKAQVLRDIERARDYFRTAKSSA